MSNVCWRYVEGMWHTYLQHTFNIHAPQAYCILRGSIGAVHKQRHQGVCADPPSPSREGGAYYDLVTTVRILNFAGYLISPFSPMKKSAKLNTRRKFSLKWPQSLGKRLLSLFACFVGDISALATGHCKMRENIVVGKFAFSWISSKALITQFQCSGLRALQTFCFYFVVTDQTILTEENA